MPYTQQNIATPDRRATHDRVTAVQIAPPPSATIHVSGSRRIRVIGCHDGGATIVVETAAAAGTRTFHFRVPPSALIPFIDALCVVEDASIAAGKLPAPSDDDDQDGVL